MVRNDNRFNKWDEIYMQKCTRGFFVLMVIEGLRRS